MLERVRAACADADGQDPLDEAAHLALKHHGLDGARLWLADGDAGFALVRSGTLTLAVAPGARGSGLGTALAAVAVPDTQTAWSHGDHPGAARLAARHGFRRDRELWVMRRPSSRPLRPLETPPDLTVRGYRATDADEVLRVNAAAFAAHPEQGRMDAAELAERMSEPWYDPEGLLVAVDAAGRMHGFHWTKRHPPVDGVRRGEVYVIAVAPEAQGRGLGRALTLAGLHHLADTDEVLLYVEAEHRAAISLYDGLGFTHAARDTHVQYHRA